MADLYAATGLRVFEVDGKACRTAPRDTFRGGSHGIAAMPALLKFLDLQGALVTIDAAGCQKEIVERIPA